MSQELIDRTKEFGKSIIALGKQIPKSPGVEVIWGQLLRSALSIGANYRAACCARSRAEFIAKLHIVREESDETQYWLELIAEATGNGESRTLLDEAKQLTAIMTVSIATAKRNASVSTRRK
jgi:four helix bundle protein